MRPQLWEQYKALVEEYKHEGWGIYDDTADMDRAVVLSDGYYGDGSSVVQVYQQTGKPIMLQNVDIVA
jgi:predicted choloylglycine hydrolase